MERGDEAEARRGRLKAAALGWAADKEVRIDLSVFAHEIGAGTAGRAIPSQPAAARFSRRFEDLSRLSPRALSAPRRMGSMEAASLHELLLSPNCQAMRAGRRRWAQVLALAGAWDFGRGQDDAESAFGEAAALAARWLVGFHPETGAGAGAGRAQGAGELIAQGRRDACEEALRSLRDFGEQAGAAGAAEVADRCLVAEWDSRRSRAPAGLLWRVDAISPMRARMEALWIEAELARVPGQPTESDPFTASRATRRL